MGHTAQNKTNLLKRVRRIRGQIEALERALETEKDCSEVLHLVSATRGAFNGLTIEVIEDHIHNHIIDPIENLSPELANEARELIHILHSYLK
jgi:DNA-binding FrmR family transcriptional regulator